MKVWIKTLQGKSFHVEIENPETKTILDVKSAIESSQGLATFPIAGQKLIHSGKVLKDDVLLTGASDATNCAQLTEDSFLVCMVTKVKAPRVVAAAPAPAVQEVASTTATVPVTPSASAASTSAVASATTSPAPTTNTSNVVPSTSAATLAASATVAATEANGPSTAELDASVRQLCDMGFPEEQVRASLQAAFNNADRAVEYLMTGIPTNVPTQALSPTPTASDAVTSSSPATTGGDAQASSLEELRHHPQFDSLRRLVQSNPSSLPAVLQQIGAQSPHLLNIIHSNQEAFVRMLNEPIAAATPTPSTPAFPTATDGASMSSEGGGPTPQQIVQMLASLPPDQQQAMAGQMGLSVEQFQQFNQLVSTMPPEALNQMLSNMGGTGAPGLPNMMQSMAAQAGNGGGGQPGQVAIQLTEEEAAAVERLCSLGFERNEVLQAYIACEKNESLAANFLMDSMGN